MSWHRAPMRRTRIRQVSVKTAARRRAYGALHSAVLERDGYRCCVCGSSDQLEVHHRLLKSRGGADTHENLLALCRFHHSTAHRAPAWATAVGLMVPAGFDPMDWPVLLDISRNAWPSASMLWQVPDGHGVWYARAPHPDQHQEPAPWIAS